MFLGQTQSGRKWLAFTGLRAECRASRRNWMRWLDDD